MYACTSRTGKMCFYLQLYGMYLNIETRLISELFTHWATRPEASASKRVLARRCSVQDSRIRSYFFAMLSVVHRELTDGSYKWFRKGARKCSQWPFLLDIVLKTFFRSKYIIHTLLMFCLLNPQMNVCEPNPKTTSSDFSR